MAQQTYPRQHSVARVLAMALCLSVCLSVFLSQVGVLLKRPNKTAWFWHGSFLRPILHCAIRKFGYLRNKCNFLLNFAPNSGLRKLRHGISIVETCYQLSSRKVDAHSVINWTVVGQLRWQYLRAPTLDSCSLSQWSSWSVYSTITSRGSISDRWYLCSCPSLQ